MGDLSRPSMALVNISKAVIAESSSFEHLHVKSDRVLQFIATHESLSWADRRLPHSHACDVASLALLQILHLRSQDMVIFDICTIGTLQRTVHA
jgi:hypothetical protein